MYLKKLFAVCLAGMLVGCSGQQGSVSVETSPAERATTVHYLRNEMPHYDALNFPGQRAVWLTYIDMAKLVADTPEEFEDNLSEVFDRVAELGLNTVYLHVRAFADAYYKSELFPPAEILPVGADGELLYDPLKTAVYLAHQRGLSLHAWINPLRCANRTGMERLEGYEPYEWFAEPDIYPEYISSPEDSPHYWLDPAVPEVREYIAAGVRELCGYDIDGIHIDDYFYPTTDPSFDCQTYTGSGTELTLANWRMENCTALVKLIHDTVKSCDPELLFGISPQGNVENNYQFMFADVRRWCSEPGFADYIVPQIYFSYSDPVCPFEQTAEKWRELCSCGEVSLVCGLGLYKAGGDTAEESFESEPGVIARQIGTALSEGYDGFALYSLGQLFAEESARFAQERECIVKILAE